MNRTPWQLWDLRPASRPSGADTVEAIGVLERGAARAWKQRGDGLHPGLLHMYIHLMEMSPHPERALRVGDQLRDLVPDAGHLRHMPTHIDVLCGLYRDVVVANEQAIEADRKYLEREGPLNFYSLYRCHDYHFKLYGAMFLGQLGPALEAADEMVATLPDELLRVEVPPDGGLARGVRADEDARARPLRPLAGDHRRAAAARSEALLRHDRADALREGRRATRHSATSQRPRSSASRFAAAVASACRPRATCSTTPASTSWPSPRRC